MLASPSIDDLVDGFTVRSDRERPAGAADRIAIVLGARVVPCPRARGLLAVALRHPPGALERLRVLDRHLCLDGAIVNLAHARRRAALVAEDEPGAIDDDITVLGSFEADGREDERVPFPMSHGRAVVG